MVAIVGSRLRHASPAAALEGVRGYTCGNDVTAREIQAAEEQWTRAKGFDTFCALGPRVVAIDPSDAGILTRVNGEVRQRASSREMVVGVGELLAYISDCMTLEPGDAVFTGTPAGVGTAARRGRRGGRDRGDRGPPQPGPGRALRLCPMPWTVYRCEHQGPTTRRRA